ncbi:MAG: hypothetical protein ACK5SI_15405 [Planctomycetia bacterium]
MPKFPVRRRGPGRRSTVAIAGTLLLTAAAGCQTSRPTTYPPTAIGQQAPYGGWATQPQGAAYPASPAPMPGPAPQPIANSWPQAPAPTTAAMPQAPQQPMYNGPSSQSIAGNWQQMNTQAQQQAQQAYANAQQQVNQLTNQYQQQANQMANQYGNQAQQQANQYMNQAQQQAQQAMNQANQQMNQALQSGQQQFTAQMPQYPPQQPTSTTWNPFATPATSQPPARAVPVAVPRY